MLTVSSELKIRPSSKPVAASFTTSNDTLPIVVGTDLTMGQPTERNCVGVGGRAQTDTNRREGHRSYRYDGNQNFLRARRNIQNSRRNEPTGLYQRRKF